MFNFFGFNIILSKVYDFYEVIDLKKKYNKVDNKVDDEKYNEECDALFDPKKKSQRKQIKCANSRFAIRKKV